MYKYVYVYVYIHNIYIHTQTLCIHTYISAYTRMIQTVYNDIGWYGLKMIEVPESPAIILQLLGDASLEDGIPLKYGHVLAVATTSSG